jgi:hypothetical protein
MKLPSRLIAFGVVASLLVLVVASTTTKAQSTLSDEQLQRISANCLSAKSSLTQLHASDALLRVNRGQLYESIGAKLMNNFNTRLTSNSLDARGLQLVTTNYKAALETFRSDYQAYERKVSDAIRIDCVEEPLAFYLAIEDARDKREKVHTDVARLHQYINDYRSAVNDFLINFERVSGDSE